MMLLGVATKVGGLNGVHRSLFLSVVIFFLVLSLWGGFLFLRGIAPSGSYLGALAIGEALALVQALTGLILLGSGHHPANTALHLLYGAVVLLAAPIAYFSVGHRGDRNASGWLAVACLLVTVIALVRSTSTG